MLYHLWGTGGVSSQETTRSSQASGSELKPLWEPIPSGGVEPGGDLLAYVRDTSTNCFSSNASYVPPLVLPSWLGTGQILTSKSLGILYLDILISLCNKHWIHIMFQALSSRFFFFNYIACLFPNVYVLVWNAIMKINNNSYHFLNTHSSHILWRMRFNNVRELV